VRAPGVGESKGAADSLVRALQPPYESNPADIDRLAEQIKIEGEAGEVLVDIAPRDLGPPCIGRQNP
jgi:hypothetical protein